MKMLTIIVVAILLLTLMPAIGNCWVGDTQLRQIETRIEETERKLLEMDKEQLLNRLDWADWGIELLQNDVREMEKEMQKKRERWEELRNTKIDSDEAWREWERSGRELDELDRKKARLDSTLERLKRLQNRIKQRIKEIERIYEPKPFSLGLGIGSLKLKNDSLQVFELKLRTLWLDLFYESDGYEKETEKVRVTSLGGEIPITVWEFSNGRIAIPLGAQKFSDLDGISFCGGFLIEYKYRNAKDEITTCFLQWRMGFGEETRWKGAIGIFF
ncbi:MAG: hypothetical protein DRH33_06855 [Candidatus Nealsonbacteria bacterium]|nr:MAG: hypothetical protein DRH33_06855 [Candidatus Nealsonbacteria bacterium]